MIHRLEVGKVVGFVMLKGKCNGQQTTGSFPVMKGQTRAQAEKEAVKVLNQMEGASGFKVVPYQPDKKETAQQRNERLGKGRRNR